MGQSISIELFAGIITILPTAGKVVFFVVLAARDRLFLAFLKMIQCDCFHGLLA